VPGQKVPGQKVPGQKVTVRKRRINDLPARRGIGRIRSHDPADYSVTPAKAGIQGCPAMRRSWIPLSRE
jgi:hypothetical protein